MSARVPNAQVSPEFFIRVNDFLAMANRIGTRHSSAHAQLAMLHAFARYSAYHYRSTSKTDSADERQAFANYMGQLLTALVADHLHEVAGPLGGSPAEGAGLDAGAPDVTLSAVEGADGAAPGSDAAE